MTKKKYFIILLLIIPLLVHPISAKRTELIGVPTADVLGHNQFNTALYFTAATQYSDDNVPFSYNLALSYGLLNMLDFTLHMYTYKDYALQVQYNILKDTKSAPAFSVGLKNISYEKFIDEGGGGSDVNSGLMDYGYPTRSQDWFSLYAVATKDFGAYGKYTVGVGRGEFVGYDRGRYLSSVAFFNNTDLDGSIVNEFMFGLFGGVEIPILKNLSFVGDLDGRDVNLGLRYFTEVLQVSAALTHTELFTANNPALRPRVEIGANYLFDFGGKTEKKEYGFLVINIVDAEKNQLMAGTVTFEEMNINPILIKKGTIKMQLKPGKYTIKVDADGYKWQKRIFTVAAGTTSELNVQLNKKDDAQTKQHDQALALAKEGKGKLDKGDIAGALIKLEEAVKLSPKDPTVLAYLQEAKDKKQRMINTHRANALMYEEKGWSKTALGEWNALLVLDKNNAEAKKHVSDLNAKIKADEKKEENKVVTKKEPTGPKADPEKIYNDGYKLFLEGKYADAVKKFEEVLKIDPNHKKAKQYLDKAKSRM